MGNPSKFSRILRVTEIFKRLTRLLCYSQRAEYLALSAAKKKQLRNRVGAKVRSLPLRSTNRTKFDAQMLRDPPFLEQVRVVDSFLDSSKIVSFVSSRFVEATSRPSSPRNLRQDHYSYLPSSFVGDSRKGESAPREMRSDLGVWWKKRGVKGES